MPAHVTLIYPFAPLEEVDTDALGALFAGADQFDYSLGAVREFDGGVVYLAPDPAAPFVELTRLLVERFPRHAPYGGQFEVDELVPHVTVVHTADADVRADAAPSVSDALPIACRADAAWLVHEDEGRWRRHAAFPLGRPG